MLNWRQWTLNAFMVGCFIAFLMMCDETDNTMQEFISLRVKAVALMLACGIPLCGLYAKWGRKGKIRM